MSRNFSPQNNFQNSPMHFQNRFRMQQNQQQSFQNTSPRMQFRSPVSVPGFQIRNNYQGCSPVSSPRFHSSPRMYSPRNKSPYFNKRNSYNNSWNNQSLDSSANSSAYLADVSGSPQSLSGGEQKFLKQKNKFSQDDSNPGHSDNIDNYIHPSMLEDPWEKDMIVYEQKLNLSTQSLEDSSS